MYLREALVRQIKDFLWNHFIKWSPPSPFYEFPIYFFRQFFKQKRDDFEGCLKGVDGDMAESLHFVMDHWIQCKLGKQYLLKKITLPWESNPGHYSYPGRSGNHYSVLLG